MFSVFDKESGVYMHTGRNSATREECVRDVVEFTCQDMSEDSDADILMTSSIDDQEGYLLQMGYVVEEHDELITDDGWENIQFEGE